MGRSICVILILISSFLVSCAAPISSAQKSATPCRGSMPPAAGKFANTPGEPIVSVPILSSNDLGVGFFIETSPDHVFIATARHVVPLRDDCGILFTLPGQKTFYEVSVGAFKKWSGDSDAFIVYELPQAILKEVSRLAKNGELRIFTVSNAPGPGESAVLPIANTGKYTVLRVSNARKSGDDRIIADLFGTACQGDSGTPIIDVTKTSVVGVLSAIEMNPPYFTLKDGIECSSRVYFTPAIQIP